MAEAPSPAGVRVRDAVPADTAAIVEMVHELAAYEKAAHRVEASEADLGAALFGPSPRVWAKVGELSTGEVAGMAVYFLSFSTWTGRHGIYLEDLYVRPHARRLGLGRRLMQALAVEALGRGLPRVEWLVLDWNAPAIEFYRSLGAVTMDGWTTFRLSGEALDVVGRPAAPGAPPGS